MPSKWTAAILLALTPLIFGQGAIRKTEPIRMLCTVAVGMARDRAQPNYPAEARRSGLGGTVIVEVTISKNGRSRVLKVMTGEPVLAAAAVDALTQWRWGLFFLNGKPVERATTVAVIFLPAEGKASVVCPAEAGTA